MNSRKKKKKKKKKQGIQLVITESPPSARTSLNKPLNTFQGGSQLLNYFPSNYKWKYQGCWQIYLCIYQKNIFLNFDYYFDSGKAISLSHSLGFVLVRLVHPRLSSTGQGLVYRTLWLRFCNSGTKEGLLHTTDPRLSFFFFFCKYYLHRFCKSLKKKRFPMQQTKLPKSVQSRQNFSQEKSWHPPCFGTVKA